MGKRTRLTRLHLRLACIILTFCFMAAMSSPAARALTPQEEQSLQTEQRSLNNPQGGFAAPELPNFWWFHPDTWNAGQLIVSQILRQILIGGQDADAIQRIFAYAPIVREGDALPPLQRLELRESPAYMLSAGIRDMYIALQATEDPDVYRAILLYANRAGERFWTPSGVLYNPATGIIWDELGRGVMETGLDYDTRQQMTFAPLHCWQSLTGFNVFYDLLAPLILFFYDTLRFPFAYDGRDWQIQFWKGYYLVYNGAEVGIYEKPPGQPLFYDASDLTLDMSVQLYHGGELYFDYGPANTWWAAAFSYAKPFWQQLPPRRLRMTGTILFEDQGMLEAFLASFEANRPANMTGGAEGLLFRFDWQVG